MWCYLLVIISDECLSFENMEQRLDVLTSVSSSFDL